MKKILALMLAALMLLSLTPVLAEEAVKSAIQDYYEKNHIEYDHSKFPKKEDCESCCRMV